MEEKTIGQRLARLWWIPLVTGIICIGLGIWTFCCPVESMIVLAYTFAFCMIVAGCLDLGYAFANTSAAPNWGWSLALGIIEVIFGIWLLSMPAGVLTVAFMYAVAIWILIVSINAICEACSLSGFSTGWLVIMIILLLATIFFAVYILCNPILGGIAVWLWIGMSFVVYGVYRIVFATQIRKLLR